MNEWLQKSKVAAVILVVLRIYLGYKWLTSGLHKFTDGFDATGYLKNAIENPALSPTGDVQYPWYVSILESVALPMSKVVNVLIPLAEVIAGALLIVGLITSAAAVLGLLMNFMFLFAGTISINPLMVLIGVLIVAAGLNAGLFGLDRFAGKFLNNRFMHFFNYYPDRYPEVTAGHVRMKEVH